MYKGTLLYSRLGTTGLEGQISIRRLNIQIALRKLLIATRLYDTVVKNIIIIQNPQNRAALTY